VTDPATKIGLGYLLAADRIVRITLERQSSLVAAALAVKTTSTARENVPRSGHKFSDRRARSVVEPVLCDQPSDAEPPAMLQRRQTTSSVVIPLSATSPRAITPFIDACETAKTEPRANTSFSPFLILVMGRKPTQVDDLARLQDTDHLAPREKTTLRALF
jgi:hypothetical protein